MEWKPINEYDYDESPVVDIWSDYGRFADVYWVHSSPYAIKGAFYKEFSDDRNPLTWIKPTHFLVVEKP